MNIETQVFDIFNSFLRDLSKTFPEIKNSLYRNYDKELTGENLKLDDCPKVKTFLEKINEHRSLIEKRDETLFSKDIDFLEEISFERLWTKNISEKTKSTVWKYFQTFSIININLNSSEQLKDVLESMGKTEDPLTKDDIKTNIKDKKTAGDLKDLKKLAEEIKKDQGVEGEPELDGMMEGLLDSDIGKIAKEVASTMDINSMIGEVDKDTNPMELMSQLMDPQKMGAIFQNINSVMESKIESGELSTEGLKGQAQDIYGSMTDNPLFSNLMQSMGQPPPRELTEEEKKKKLRKKIRKKEKFKKSRENEEHKEKVREKLRGKEKEKNSEESEANKDKLRKKIREKANERKGQ